MPVISDEISLTEPSSRTKSIVGFNKHYLEWLFPGVLYCLKKLMFSDDEWIVISFMSWQNFRSLFRLLAKSSLLKFRSSIFTGFTSFLSGSYPQDFVVQAGLGSPSVIAGSTRNKAAATWLHAELIPAIQVQWAVITFPFFLDKHTHNLWGVCQSLRNAAVFFQ